MCLFPKSRWFHAIPPSLMFQKCHVSPRFHLSLMCRENLRIQKCLTYRDYQQTHLFPKYPYS